MRASAGDRQGVCRQTVSSGALGRLRTCDRGRRTRNWRELRSSKNYKRRNAEATADRRGLLGAARAGYRRSRPKPSFRNFCCFSAARLPGRGPAGLTAREFRESIFRWKSSSSSSSDCCLPFHFQRNYC